MQFSLVRILHQFSVNLCEFPLTALYGDAGDEYVCRFVTVGVLFAQTPGLHFSAHHGFSFLLIIFALVQILHQG